MTVYSNGTRKTAFTGMLRFLIVPILVILVLPIHIGRISGARRRTPFLQFTALSAWFFGGFLILWVVQSFFQKGKGSPAPNAPTQVLVVTGLYRYTRNPMYVGALATVLGHALWFQSLPLLAYLAGLAVFFQAIVVLYEEPHLREQFGEAYERFLRQTPRWF